MFVEVFSDEGKKVTFYTIRHEDADMSETEDFFRRVHSSDYKEDVFKLSMLLANEIGDRYGAHEKYFNREERAATALPPKYYKPFKGEKTISFSYSPLRLYSYKVSDSIVVLFNGGLKSTNGSAQDDPNIRIHFRQAYLYSEKIQRAINEGMIDIQGKYMVGFDGSKKIKI
ncbi:hypothetical protein [Dokdonia sp.]|uniref:hypothetical protein n=1 Tax=Dokdonia sp. TaxID=2024995 RepID=UPI003267226D